MLHSSRAPIAPSVLEASACSDTKNGSHVRAGARDSRDSRTTGVSSRARSRRLDGTGFLSAAQII
jgi:hypothetical protein